MSQADDANVESTLPQPTVAAGGSGKRCLIAAGLLVCVGYVLLGGVYLVAIPFAVMLGWAFYLFRIVPQITFSVDGIVMFAMSLVLFAIGTHIAARWWIGRSGINDDAPNWSKRQTARLVALVCLAFVAGIGITGVVHQTGWLVTSPEPMLESSSRAFDRVESLQSLHLMGRAQLDFHDEHGHIANGSASSDGHVLHSWQTAILPYLGLNALHLHIDLDRSWRDPANRHLFEMKVDDFLNRGIHGDDQTEEGYAASHYAANQRVISIDRILSADDINDGTSETILAGELVSRFRAWGDPLNVRDPALGVNQDPDGFGGPWEGRGAQFVFADGRVQFVNAKIDPAVLRALATPDAGDQVSEF